MSKDKKNKKPKKYWEMKMAVGSNNTADIFIYGDIVRYQWEETDVTAAGFKKELDDLGEVDTINLYINSPGGSVFEGLAIYNMLARHKATINVYVDALAGSIASVIAMVGTIHMPKNAMLMIHNPWNIVVGNAAELRKAADDLDRIGNLSVQSYLQKAGDKLTEESLQELLDAETWLSADQALSYGLCDVVLEENQMVASISDELLERYKNVPEKLKKPEQRAGISAEELVMRQQIADAAKSNKSYLDVYLGGI